mmetsp:Transcript_16575/g.46352  ORF Transcript_16575/g.46352 Transcript_16575/m.46352 type:complete len:87 (-) Transcript_16575:120-380(-)
MNTREIRPPTSNSRRPRAQSRRREETGVTGSKAAATITTITHTRNDVRGKQQQQQRQQQPHQHRQDQAINQEKGMMCMQRNITYVT